MPTMPQGMVAFTGQGPVKGLIALSPVDKLVLDDSPEEKTYAKRGIHESWFPNVAGRALLHTALCQNKYD
jgi:hypothetical protein